MPPSVTLSALLLALCITHALSTTYYFSSTGNDANAGTSARSPWRSVGKIVHMTWNDAVKPGDVFRFLRGGSFVDASLDLDGVKGTAKAPITFEAYGKATDPLPTLSGIWLNNAAHLSFIQLHVDGGGKPAGGLVASSPHDGSTHITLRNCVVENSPGLGINIAKGTYWRIQGNVLRNLGDSGILTLGSKITITRNTITNVGWNNEIAYAKHGIYAKGPDMDISYNDISHVSQTDHLGGQAVSVRFHNIKVRNNYLHDTGPAVQFYDFDGLAKHGSTSYISNNCIWNVKSFFFYAPECSYITWSGADYSIHTCNHQPNINFDISGNTVVMPKGGEAWNLLHVPKGVTVKRSKNKFTYGKTKPKCAKGH